MSQSLAQIYIHSIFSTKYRRPLIKPAIQDELYAYMGDNIVRLKGIPFLVNGVEDHVHIFSTLPKTVALCKFIEDIKRNSSRWIKTKGAEFHDFAWQNGYASFSVSSSRKNAVLRYIANQKAHHRKQTFKEEVLRFLDEYGVEYDERYLWD